MMNEPIFEVKIDEGKENYGRFIISPLEQGYGDTLGNSLRRILLTSIPGAAITSVRISGIKHQFSTLKGMKEDVVELLLNLKKVRFTYVGEKTAKATISAVGPKEVKAQDIKGYSSLKVANPNIVLAYLNKGLKLDVKLDIENGVGYSASDDRVTGEIGLIPLDASFSPVTRVKYEIEETRVGRLTNYDKLILDVWTDCTINPKEALVTSAKILVSYFSQIVSPKKVKDEVKKDIDILGPTGKLSVEEIGLPTRVANALLKAGHETVEDLIKAKRDDLVRVRNLGEKSVKIIEAALGEKGINLSQQ